MGLEEVQRMKRATVAMVTAAALIALGACKNGSNNARDTSGMPSGPAPGSAGAAAPRTDTIKAATDTTKAATDTAKKRP
jgi:hypothetical protein